MNKLKAAFLALMMIPGLAPIQMGIAGVGMDESQPDATAVLQKVAATYRSMSSLKAQGEMVTRTSAPGMEQKLNLPVTLTFAPPRRMRIEASSPTVSLLMVSDGRTMWIYLPQLNKYMKFGLGAAGAVGSTPALGDMSRLQHMGEYGGVAKNVLTAKILRSESVTVNGASADCYVMEVHYQPPVTASSTQPIRVKILSLTRTFWVDKARDLIVREDADTRMTLGDASAPTESQHTVTFKTLQLNQPVEDSLFTFTPPEGATELDLKQLMPASSSSPP